MSGNGRGGNGNGGPSNGGTCQAIYRGARLASPKNDAVTQLKSGDILDLQVVQQGKSFVLFAMADGKQAGTVTHGSITQIIRCIQEGHVYVALIKKREGGNFEIDIRLKNQ